MLVSSSSFLSHLWSSSDIQDFGELCGKEARKCETQMEDLVEFNNRSHYYCQELLCAPFVCVYVCVVHRLCVCVCVCGAPFVFVCVCVRERQRQRQRHREIKGFKSLGIWIGNSYNSILFL